MRKRIKSADFAAQLSTDIQELKAVKKQMLEAKKQAKANKNADNDNLTKEEKKALKIEFTRAKIRYKAAKYAWKAAHKVIAPYLLEEILSEEKKSKKKVKHKNDEEAVGSAAKPTKAKKVKEVKEEKEPKLKKRDKEEKGTRGKKSVKTEVFMESSHANVEKTAAKTVTTVIKNDTVVPTASKPVTTGSTTTKALQKPDDLTIIEGIGPKIAEVLAHNGVSTFKQLSLSAPDYIKDILQKNNLRLADPTTWAEQARLAAEGKMEALESLKKELKGGKRT